MYDHIKIPQEDQKLRIARGSKLKKELRFIGTNTVQILQILTHYVNYLCLGPAYLDRQVQKIICHCSPLSAMSMRSVVERGVRQCCSEYSRGSDV